MANIPYPNIPYPRLSCWWVLNLFCDKRYQITFKIQNVEDDDIYKMLNFLIDNISVQCGGRVLQHLICINIGTVRPTHRLVSSLTVYIHNGTFGMNIDVTRFLGNK